MRQIDWNENVVLLCSGPHPPDGDVERIRITSGRLCDMINFVFRMPNEARSGVQIDGPSFGSMGVFEIIALSMRDDFPR